ncbi:MAG: phospholipase [Gemmatimonadetes bacterium]|nr:phospholipase [Gemmatimonadota bacterium]
MIREHQLPVTRTARYFTLGEIRDDLEEVWFGLHGYGQLGGSFLRRFEPLAGRRRLVVAPEGLSRFYLGDHTRPAGPDAKVGASWMTREDRLAEIADYVTYLDTLYGDIFRQVPRDAVRVQVLGFSQGTATATRWLARGRARADRLILWGAPLPTDLDLAVEGRRLRELDLTIVAGERDEYLTAKVLASEEARLTDAGIPYRVIRFPGGHEIDEAVLRELTLGRTS